MMGSGGGRSVLWQVGRCGRRRSVLCSVGAYAIPYLQAEPGASDCFGAMALMHDGICRCREAAASCVAHSRAWFDGCRYDSGNVMEEDVLR